MPPNTPLWSYQPSMRYYLIDESRYPQGKPGSLSGFVMRLENARIPRDFLIANYVGCGSCLTTSYAMTNNAYK